ncbi:MAG: hypothetical protein QF473_07385 [Planctomycetota bacterium]|nr:hypothetical protein [Planctomycetota bacterium]
MAVRIIQHGRDILLKTRPSITPMLVAFHTFVLGLLFYSALEGIVVGCVVSGFFLLPISVRAAFPSAVALRTEAEAIELLGGFMGFKSRGLFPNGEIRCVKVQAEAGAEEPGRTIIPKIYWPTLVVANGSPSGESSVSCFQDLQRDHVERAAKVIAAFADVEAFGPTGEKLPPLEVRKAPEESAPFIRD